MSIGMASKNARHTPGGTPGRRANITSNQYFDVGRVGRKTGVTLKDTGIRDDYGLEPLSDIFSTPGSAGRSTYIEEEENEPEQVDFYDDGSADMSDSPGQDLDELIEQRRQTSVRITPPRQANRVGRSSITQPNTNRRPQFEDNVRNSIEKRSPFKPTHVLRRSNVGGNKQRKSILTNGIGGGHSSSPGVGSSKRKSQAYLFREDDFQVAQDDELDTPERNDTLRYSTRDELEGALGHAEMLVHTSPITPRKRRLSQERLASSGRADNRSQPVANVLSRESTSAKRPRYSAPDDESTAGVHASAAAPSSRKLEKAPVYHAPTVDEEGPVDELPLFVDDDYQNNDDYDDDSNNEYDEGPDGSVDVPIAGDQHEYGGDDEDNEPPVSPLVIMTATERAKRNRQEQGEQQSPKKSRLRIAAPPRSRRRPRGEVSSDDESDEDDSETDTRRVKRGTTSNMRYRSTTPFEDADHKTTRSGRAVMKPLDWWAGEAVIWKNGEVGGVIRANSVEPEKRVVHKKRAAHKKKTQRIKDGLGAIDEQDEDLMPDEWEEEVGVYTGEVAVWDPVAEQGDDEDLVTEDLAFAASSIITRNVAGASFNYAKIQTLPFFGSGVVEIPPNGVKNTKNSKKMQMNFFVHKGKVQVTIATPPGINAVSARSTMFTITEGGAWVVPRGNNYTINNSSSTTTAFLFFSQGCELREVEEADAG